MMSKKRSRTGESSSVSSSDTFEHPLNSTAHLQQPSSLQNKARIEPAILFEWDWDEAAQKLQPCRRTILATPSALRTTLARPFDGSQARRGWEVKLDLDPDDETGYIFPNRRLVVLNGLHREFVDALLASDLGLDPAFIESCASRRPYRPAVTLQKRPLVRRMRLNHSNAIDLNDRYPLKGYMYEYPELVEGLDPASVSGITGSDDTATMPAMASVPPARDEKKHGVVFRHAAVWRGLTADVLLLDSPTWEYAGKGVCKAKRQRRYVSQTHSKGEEVEVTEEVTTNLQDVLVGALAPGGWWARNELLGMVSEAVYDRWLELFDFLEPRVQASSFQEVAECLARMTRSLEFNDDGGSDPDWTAPLLARIDRRVRLLSAMKETPSFALPASSKATTKSMATEIPKQQMPSRTDTLNPSLKSIVSRRGRPAKQGADENQRALDRLSYLGGVLIPLPIISSILSMGDTYGPDGSKFFVFWAIAAPLALLTVLLIYADTIRKAEVWVEIGADHVMPTFESKTESSEDTIRPGDVEVKHTVTWERRNRLGEVEEHPSAEHGAVPYSLEHDIEVEERIIDLPTTPASAPLPGAVRNATGDWMPRSESWGAAELLQLPMMILERPADGSKPKAWKREQLGWTGAIRRILYKRFRDGDDVPAGVEACERPGRRKTKSY